MLSTAQFVLLALKFHATMYGVGEDYCGDYDAEPEACAHGAITASGEVFNPEQLTAAVPMPRNRILRVAVVQLRAFDGECLTIRIIDKKNERFVGNSGLDLTPAVVAALTGKEATRHWSGKVDAC